MLVHSNTAPRYLHLIRTGGQFQQLQRRNGSSEENKNKYGAPIVHAKREIIFHHVVGWSLPCVWVDPCKAGQLESLIFGPWVALFPRGLACTANLPEHGILWPMTMAASRAWGQWWRCRNVSSALYYRIFVLFAFCAFLTARQRILWVRYWLLVREMPLVLHNAEAVRFTLYATCREGFSSSASTGISTCSGSRWQKRASAASCTLPTFPYAAKSVFWGIVHVKVVLYVCLVCVAVLQPRTGIHSPNLLQKIEAAPPRRHVELLSIASVVVGLTGLDTPLPPQRIRN